MRILRFEYRGQTYSAVAQGSSYHVVEDPFAKSIRTTGLVMPAEEVRLLAPVFPGKIVCVGVNYADHASEMKQKTPDEPLIFLKPNTAVIGPNDAITTPPQSGRIDYEAELAVVIGERCKNISREQSMEYILGYTCLNDVTARDLQSKDGQWTRSKGFDTFCPIGPYIETDYDWHDRRVSSVLNGQVKQQGRTGQMIYDVYTLVSYISGIMTLLPGDVIATGTPSGIGPMKKGDRIDIDIEALGVLKNVVQ